MDYMLAFLEGLNAKQRAAVEAKDGPTLVLAGPGSGKTRVLTSRIAYLIGLRNIAPYRIMAVTFTNKAAREMRDRVAQLLGASKTADLMIGTFHSICARLLRREAARAGLDRDFSIYDADDQLSVVKAALAELKLDEKKYKPASIHAAISAAKNELIRPEDYRAESYFQEIAGRVYARYNAILRASNALDFDDLIMETVRLLRSDPIVQEKLQERYLHVLVDEFQDTNLAQYVLIKLIAGRHRGLFCVGDADQSIYAWRGADYRNVLRLREDYPDLTIITLEQNYRSTQTILEAAMSVIRKNPDRVHINLSAQRGHGPKIAVRELFNEDEEAQFVVDTIEELVRQKAAQPGEIAVMYRTNAQSRPLEEAFIRAGMPYRLVGATRFYARREIRDVLAYLRIINNPADAVSLKRIINVPPRGIGERTFEQLENAARVRGVSCLDVLSRDDLSLTGRAKRAVQEFSARWAQWVRLRDELSIGQLFDYVLQTSGYEDYLRDGSAEAEERWANVLALRNVAVEAGDMMLSEFLSNVALVSDVDNYDETANAPTLLTLHAAKGLEFKVVFIVGLVEGVLPHSRSLDDPEQMAEERRLMYVGITRAKERLYLLRPFRRSQWGGSEVAEPSRFLADLPDSVVDGKPRKNSELLQATATWQSAPAKPSANSRFKPGDKVVHPRFGQGLVLRSTPTRDDEEVEVFFFDAGGKRLSATMSGLKKLKE